MKIKTKVFLIAFLIAFFTIILGGLLLRFHFLNKFLKIENAGERNNFKIEGREGTSSFSFVSWGLF